MLASWRLCDCLADAFVITAVVTVVVEVSCPAAAAACLMGTPLRCVALRCVALRCGLQPTNGVCYFRTFFDAAHLPYEDQLYLPLFNQMLTRWRWRRGGERWRHAYAHVSAHTHTHTHTQTHTHTHRHTHTDTHTHRHKRRKGRWWRDLFVVNLHVADVNLVLDTRVAVLVDAGKDAVAQARDDAELCIRSIVLWAHHGVRLARAW